MTNTKPKKKKIKRKVKIKTGAQIKKKDSVRVDTLPQMPVKKVVPDNGATFKVKIRKKR